MPTPRVMIATDIRSSQQDTYATRHTCAPCTRQQARSSSKASVVHVALDADGYYVATPIDAFRSHGRSLAPLGGHDIGQYVDDDFAGHAASTDIIDTHQALRHYTLLQGTQKA